MPFKCAKARRLYLRRWERETAQRMRLQLLEKLGSRCQMCGTQEDLEFDHIGPTKPYLSCRLSQLDRLRKYRREAERGEIQLLCGPCNRKKGTPPDEDVPF